MGGGASFGRKKQRQPIVRREPLRKAEEILANAEAMEKLKKTVDGNPPGTVMRWNKMVNAMNLNAEPTEEISDPLRIETDLSEIRKVLKSKYDDVKYIGSDGLALMREFLPKIYEKHTLERGRKLSHKEREAKNLKEEMYSYGELDSEIFSTIFIKVTTVYGYREFGIFYDLGCGVGNLVYAAAFIGNFSKVAGVEALASLNLRGDKRLGLWEYTRERFTEKVRNTVIEFIEDNFLYAAFWVEASFLLLHWTAFSMLQRRQCLKYLQACNEGTYVLTFTHPIDAPDDFDILLEDTCETSWGKAQFFFHEKTSPAKPLPPEASTAALAAERSLTSS